MSILGSVAPYRLQVTVCVQVNYNLLTVNVFMAFTGMYQLSRKIAAGSPATDSIDTHPAETAAVSGSGPQLPIEAKDLTKQ